MDYQTCIVQILEQAADIARYHFGKVSATIKPTDSNQVLTEADLEIARIIFEAIRQTYPTHNVIDEELGIINMQSSYTWVIDPIDGTSNFALGSPLYGCMVGLIKDQPPLVGGIALPFFGEIYSAEKGKGAYCNGQRLLVNDDRQLDTVLVSYGIERDQEDPARTRAESTLFAEIALACSAIQTSNSVFDAAMMLKGIYAGFLYQRCRIWDNVAQQILLEEAGMMYTDFSGQPLDYHDPCGRAGDMFAFCAAPPTIHRQLQQLITKWKQEWL